MLTHFKQFFPGIKGTPAKKGASDVEYNELDYFPPEDELEPEFDDELNIPPEADRVSKAGLIKALVVLASAAAMVLAWKYTSLSRFIRPEVVSAYIEPVRASSWAIVYVTMVYIAGGIAMIPIIVLILATALTFDPLQATAYSLVGAVFSGMTGFLIGKIAGRSVIDQYGGSKVGRINKRLARMGTFSFTAIRFFPVAPFSILSLIAGASHLRFRPFVLGTAFGLAPVIFMTSVFGYSLKEALKNPTPQQVVIMVAILAFALGGGLLMQRRLVGRKNS